MVEATEEIEIAGIPVALAMIDVDRYHEEAAFVVHRWIEIFEISVGAVMLVRPPNINLILRSRLPGLHVGRVAQCFGGGGHATAASARISGSMPVEVREQLLDILAIQMPPPATAIDIAARTIFSVDDVNSVEETKDRLNELRVNALPVRDAGAGELVGLVTRQILDRALSHGMGNRPVRSVMQPELPTVSAATPLGDLGEIFLERSLRFVVVEEAGRPAGSSSTSTRRGLPSITAWPARGPSASPSHGCCARSLRPGCSAFSPPRAGWRTPSACRCIWWAEW
jgi:tRNA nucleotidyltransferase (CCA-adding enzyme)